MLPRLPRSSGTGTRLRDAPLAVWVLVVLYGLVLACWSVLTPMYRAPDEPNQAEAVMRLVTGQGWGQPGHTFVGREGQAAIAHSPFGTPARPFSPNPGPIPAANAQPRADRPDWADLAQPPRPYSRTSIQQLTEHPPGYYWFAAGAVTLTGGAHQPWDRAVAVMRLASVLLVLPLPLLGWAAAARLTDDRRAGLAAAVVPLGIPQLAHIGASINNDNALALTAGVVTVGVAAVIRGDRSLRTSAVVGIALGLALFSKSLALVLVPMVAAAYLAAWGLARSRFRSAPETDADATAEVPASRPTVVDLLRPLVVVAVLSLAFGGWWYVVNVLRFGAVQPSVPGFPPGAFLGNHPGALVRNVTDGMLRRYWGSLGLFEVNLPVALVYGAALVVVVCALLALLPRARRPGARPSAGRTGVLLMLWPSLGAYLLVLAQAVSYYRHTHYTRGVQGRYLFLGVVGVAAVVGIGLVRVRLLRRWAAPLLFAGALVLQAVTAVAALRHWWEPVGAGPRAAWGALTAWSPWPTTVLRLLVPATAALLVLAAVVLVRAGRDRSPAGRAQPAPSE